MAVVIETTIGDITVDLFIKERPRACLNFIKLCKLKYYNYNLFHHVERNFIAQTGDPTGAGDGGQSVWGVLEGKHKRFFEAESLPKIKHSLPGLISLVTASKNMASSQFFFTLAEDLTSLDGNHCVFGEVVEGHDILRKINEAIVNEKFRPFQDIRITHTVVLDDPFDDPRGFQIPSRSPSPSCERLKNGKIGADEDIDDTDGKTAEEIQEMLASREASAQATILEIVGDLPSADVAPPENVLFVCKLNPVTNDDDLEIIFSRFGKIVGCEVIRDKQSGDSLQYAFVEFEDKKSCEAAYFKMDNVLIDDRRIHVDFSQSVAKVQWRGKGRGLIHRDGDNNDTKLDFTNYREMKYKHLIERKQRSPRNRNREFNRKRSPVSRRERSRSSDRRNKSSHRNHHRNRRSPFRYGSRCDNWNYSNKRSETNFEPRRRENHRRIKSPERQKSNSSNYRNSSNKGNKIKARKRSTSDSSSSEDKKRNKKKRKKTKKESTSNSSTSSD